jgi:cytochrome c5
MFTVPTGSNFQDPACKGVDFICWPTVGISDIEFYESKGKGIPGWDKVLLVTTLKRGSLYVLPLSADGKSAAGRFSRYFQSENRFRDTAVSPDGRTIYIATDPGGVAGAADAGSTSKMENPGAILAFTYAGEGGPVTAAPAPTAGAASQYRDEPNPAPIVNAVPPNFTAAQAAKGKTAYTATCAVCHGAAMTDGTYATPLAGQYFKTKWSRRSVRALYDRVRNTMPPSAPNSLPADTYADIVAHILEVNGFKPGNAALRPGDATLNRMELK